MTVLLYGDFGPFELGSSYKRAFEAQGCEVQSVDRRNREDMLQSWFGNRLVQRLSRASLWMRRLGARRWNEHLKERCRETNPDFVLLLKGDCVMPETVEALRHSGTPVLHFHPDRPFPSAPSYRPETLPAMKECDHCFIWSRSLKARLEDRDMDATYLTFAWDPVVYPRLERPSSWEHEVSFIGNWDAKRERTLSRVAERFDLKVWGSEYWQTHTSPNSPVRDCWQGGGLFGEEASEAIVASKITLNILRDQNCPDGTNMRTFEIPGAGGFALATRTTGAEEIFAGERAGAYFEDPDDLVDKIDHYLAHPEKREDIAATARDVVDDHTYERRAEAILNVVSSFDSNPS